MEEKAVFEAKVAIQPCSWQQCTKGHQWPPTLALVPCVGCGTQSLMVKLENCPFCNEPAIKVSLRTDHIPIGAGVAQRCKGQEPVGESIQIDMERSGWAKYSELEDLGGKNKEIIGR